MLDSLNLGLAEALYDTKYTKILNNIKYKNDVSSEDLNSLTPADQEKAYLTADYHGNAKVIHSLMLKIPKFSHNTQQNALWSSIEQNYPEVAEYLIGLYIRTNHKIIQDTLHMAVHNYCNTNEEYYDCKVNNNKKSNYDFIRNLITVVERVEKTYFIKKEKSVLSPPVIMNLIQSIDKTRQHLDTLVFLCKEENNLISQEMAIELCKTGSPYLKDLLRGRLPKTSLVNAFLKAFDELKFEKAEKLFVELFCSEQELAFNLAVKNGNDDVIAFIIQHPKRTIRQECIDKEFLNAIQFGHDSVAKLLFKYVERKNYGLFMAFASSQHLIIEWLLKQNWEDKLLVSKILSQSASEGNIKIVKNIFKNKAALRLITSEDKQKAFLKAAKHGHLEVMAYLRHSCSTIDSKLIIKAFEATHHLVVLRSLLFTENIPPEIIEKKLKQPCEKEVQALLSRAYAAASGRTSDDLEESTSTQSSALFSLTREDFTSLIFPYLSLKDIFNFHSTCQKAATYLPLSCHKERYPLKVTEKKNMNLSDNDISEDNVVSQNSDNNMETKYSIFAKGFDPEYDGRKASGFCHYYPSRVNQKYLVFVKKEDFNECLKLLENLGFSKEEPQSKKKTSDYRIAGQENTIEIYDQVYQYIASLIKEINIKYKP